MKTQFITHLLPSAFILGMFAFNGCQSTAPKKESHHSQVQTAIPVQAAPLIQAERAKAEPAVAKSLAFKGRAQSVPGVIEAEYFDVGANGSSYVDTSPGNTGPNDLRVGTDVDLESMTDGGIAIGWVEVGEQWDYTINAKKGVYDIAINYARGNKGDARISLFLNNSKVGSSDLTYTGSWNEYQLIDLKGIEIPTDGIQKITVVADTHLLNLDSFTFTLQSDSN
jgi:hypothetical protein